MLKSLSSANVAEKESQEAPEIQPPDDFASKEEFLAYIRDEVALDEAADKENRDAATEDMQFFVGDQWDTAVKARRARKKKPVMTENYMPAFVGQVTGNRRLNEVAIKVLPDGGGNKAEATVREGLLRNMQKTSRAKVAFDAASETQIVCGIGNFQLKLEEAYDDVFKQDMVIEGFPDHLSVLWDRMRTDPTGRDARHVTISDRMSKKDFQREYPWATAADVLTDPSLLANGWLDQDTVRVASFWRMRKRIRPVAMLTNGAIHWLDEGPVDPAMIAVDPTTGAPMIREDALCPYAQLYIVTGTDLLAGPYDLPVYRVPVFRVPGWEIFADGKWHRWGIVRFLKDPQRYLNYWRSVRAEKLLQTPKAKFIASAEAVQGREKEWRDAHISDDPLLIFNGEAGQMPTQVPPAQLEPAISEEVDRNKQVLKDISNIHEAALGQQSNEVSGRAIVARQRVGELGSVVFIDNENMAIEECGRVANQLIRYVYSGPRIEKVLGPDDKVSLQALNQAGGIDITGGKYTVTVTTGPSYVTKRLEQRQSMETVFNAAPQAMQPMLDLWFEAFDFPGSDKMAERARKMLPPGLVEPETPEEQAAQEGAARAAALKSEVDMKMAQTEIAEKLATIEEKRARAALLREQAAAVPDNTRIKAASEETKARSTMLHDHLDAISVAHEGEEKRAESKQGE